MDTEGSPNPDISQISSRKPSDNLFLVKNGASQRHLFLDVAIGWDSELQSLAGLLKV